MKWFIAYKDSDQIIVVEYKSRDIMLEAVSRLKSLGCEILCVWTEAL